MIMDLHHTRISYIAKLANTPSFLYHRFWPGTFKLHVRDGDKSNGNAGCDPPKSLKPLTKYKVKIQLRDTRVAVYVNDAQVCTSARQDRAVYKKALVYAADPYVQREIVEFYQRKEEQFILDSY